MKRLIDAGIDGFFTNDPATGRRVVDEAGRGSGRKGVAALPDAERAPGCPAGAGVGLQRADTATTTTPTSNTPEDNNVVDTAKTDSDDDGAPVVIAVIVAAVAAVAAVGATVIRRRARQS
jgi:MYXO-CTERM domain-containing protein